MLAVYYEIYGNAEVLQIGELHKPDCGEQVLIKAMAAEAHLPSAHRRSESSRTWGKLVLSIATL